MKFIGRKKELAILEDQLKKKVASLVVLRGRRRIGKSRLIEEFGQSYEMYLFTGLPPTQSTTMISQQQEFLRQIRRQFKTPLLSFEDWGDIFWYLAEKLQNRRIILVFDEISWMGSKDPDFLGKLKTAWDQHFKKNPALMLILCGSVSAWIEKNIISSTGFVGRLSCTLTLSELSLSESNQFFMSQKENMSGYEKFKLLSVTGGVPRYLEELRPTLSAEQNLKKICFSPEGFLFNEFNQIVSDLFLCRTALYHKALAALIEKNLEPSSLSRVIETQLNSSASEYFKELVLAGFLARDYAWDFKTGKVSKLSTFRLKDNYTRFYLKYILANQHKIENHAFQEKSLSLLPGWSTIMGLQFENLILNNRHTLAEFLEISADEMIWDNPVFQRKTSKQAGCQVDYLIQTKYNTLYLCEIKFSLSVIPYSIIEEVQEKIKRLSKPKGFSVRPVLIHVNGVSPQVIEADYFSKILDFNDFLKD